MERLFSVTLIIIYVWFSEDSIQRTEEGYNSGHMAFAIVKKFPMSTIYGFDISEEAIAVAKQYAKDKGMDNEHHIVFVLLCCYKLLSTVHLLTA